MYLPQEETLGRGERWVHLSKVRLCFFSMEGLNACLRLGGSLVLLGRRQVYWEVSRLP